MLKSLIVLAQFVIGLPCGSKINVELFFAMLANQVRLIGKLLYRLLFKLNRDRKVIHCFDKVTLGHQRLPTIVKHFRVLWFEKEKLEIRGG